MALDLTYNLANYTPADASPVGSNFNRIEQYINQEVINRDGSVAMTGQLKLVGNPVAADDAASKAYVDAVLPIGIIMQFGGSAAPASGRWAVCDGAAVATATYPDLFGVLGYTYGGSGGSFNLPNLVDRVAVGALSPRGGVTAVGQTGGSRDAVVMTHTHPIDHNHGAATSGYQDTDHSHRVEHQHSVDLWTGDEFGIPGFPAQHGHKMLAGTTGVYRANSGAAYKMHVSSATSTGFAEQLGVDVIDLGDPAFATGTNNYGHRHATNGATGLMGSYPGQGDRTEGQSANHRHSTTVAAHAGASGDAVGAVSGVGSNMPPYVGVNNIIRVL